MFRTSWCPQSCVWLSPDPRLQTVPELSSNLTCLWFSPCMISSSGEHAAVSFIKEKRKERRRERILIPFVFS
ncbi:rCG58488 [Rattus norvegicus]|uniref:RCG58488 n=1 Tax=Rattus norvegicus TaxID=10116 RepID=A6K6X9_RAT|nr:rCG58488 [Rattus norvegicus]